MKTYKTSAIIGTILWFFTLGGCTPKDADLPYEKRFGGNVTSFKPIVHEEKEQLEVVLEDNSVVYIPCANETVYQELLKRTYTPAYVDKEGITFTGYIHPATTGKRRDSLDRRVLFDVSKLEFYDGSTIETPCKK